MKSVRNNSLIVVFIALLRFIGSFIKKAYNKGRTMELLSSTAVLSGVECAFYNYGIMWQWYLLPLGIYALYWTYLFSVEKVTSNKANPNWADRNWWWQLDGWEFEEEVAKIFALNGYDATVTKKTGDGGIDIILKKDKRKIIAQCKHYTSEVGPEAVRALWGVKDDFKADEVIMIASSGVTKASREFIKNKVVYKVLDLEDIIRMGLRPTPYK